MKYNTDRPIETAEQDLPGRASFSKQIGKAIYSIIENYNKYEAEQANMQDAIKLVNEWKN